MRTEISTGVATITKGDNCFYVKESHNYKSVFPTSVFYLWYKSLWNVIQNCTEAQNYNKKKCRLTTNKLNLSGFQCKLFK